MALVDIRELKSWLDIDPEDCSEDKNLNFFLETACGWIEELLNRRGSLFQKERTEFYDGSGRQTLLLRSRPIESTPTVQCWVDEDAYYGTPTDSFSTDDALTYGEDFSLKLDDPEDNTRSLSGMLIRIRNVWPRPHVRVRGYLTPFVGQAFGNVKVTYTGGYAIDDLPSTLKTAVIMLVAKIRFAFPLGMEASSVGYEGGMSVSVLAEKKDYFTSTVRQLIQPFINYNF